MEENRAFSIGLRNVDDASFIRANFIPIAIKNKKWNLVVSEAHRAAELLLNGLIHLAVGFHSQTLHNLEGLAEKFGDSLTQAKGSLPFAVGYYSGNGDCYGLMVKKNSIQVLQRLGSVYMVIASIHDACLASDTRAKIDLEVSESGEINLSINGNLRIRHTGNIPKATPLVPIRRRLDIAPRSKRLIELKQISKCFTHKSMIDARYSKREFTESEALEAKSQMDRIFELSENMVSVEE